MATVRLESAFFAVADNERDSLASRANSLRLLILRNDTLLSRDSSDLVGRICCQEMAQRDDSVNRDLRIERSLSFACEDNSLTK